MTKVLVTESSLNDIAEAIRGKNGSSDVYKPGQMASAITAIPTGGITPTGTVQITQNGTHDVTQYASANVNVPNSYAAGDEGKVVSNGALVAQTSRNIAANGAYDTTTNNEVVVSVTPYLQSKTVTQNGTVTPDQGYDGLSSVVVNVQGGGGGSAIILADNTYQTSGSYTYDKTVTVPESGTYKIAVQAYTSDLTVKINNVAQTLTMEVSSDYTRLYSATISMSAGDVIDIYATSSGRSTVTAFIIKE